MKAALSALEAFSNFANSEGGQKIISMVPEAIAGIFSIFHKHLVVTSDSNPIETGALPVKITIAPNQPASVPFPAVAK